MDRYQVMPPLSDEEFAELKADIAKRGVQVPVEYDEDGNVLDGYHRIRACHELGITDWPRIVRTGLTEEQKRLHARKLNLARRHLTQEQKRELLREQLRETPEKSDRQIASSLDVDHKTVGAIRKFMATRGEIPHVDTVFDSLGRQQPRQVERRPPEPPAPQPADEYTQALTEFPELKDFEPEQAVIAAKQLRTMPPKEQARAREAAKTWHLIKDQPSPAEAAHNSPYAVLGRLFECLESFKRRVNSLDPPLLDRIAELTPWEFEYYATRLQEILPEIDLLKDGFTKRQEGGSGLDESTGSPEEVNQ